jgi:hypothetical protein
LIALLRISGGLFYSNNPKSFQILQEIWFPYDFLMKKLIFITGAFLFTSINPITSLAQQSTNPLPYFTYGKGLGIISPDSLFLLNIRFRIQNRVAFKTVDTDDFTIDEVEARVRRLRLRFDGFVYTPRLNYVIQLAFTRADMDFDDTGVPNIVRDAMVIYNVNPHFAIGLGQTKLPGNRQRVNSSGDLQLVDRSIVNAKFNIDRDFGVQFYYNNKIGFLNYVLRGAISSGEGRNISASDRGLAYTGRVELLPLGLFTNNGDYFEGDLAREPKPKVSVGVSYSDNENTTRTGGQLGRFLYSPRDIETAMMDFLFKHNGWAFSAELLKRSSNNPITTDSLGQVRYVYAGHGQNFQGSYLLRSNIEFIARFSEVRPNPDIQLAEPRTRQYTLGVTKYLRGHRVKLQSDFTLEQNDWLKGPLPSADNFQWRFQIEIGI